jgi:DNA primase
MIPAEVIAEVRARNDLVAFIEAAGVQLRRRGADYVGRCPFHAGGAERNPSLVVSPRKQYWCCHGACSANGKRVGGDVIEFARRLWNVGFREAVARLGGNVPDAPTARVSTAVVKVRNGAAMQPGRLLERVVDYYQKCFLSSLPA